MTVLPVLGVTGSEWDSAPPGHHLLHPLGRPQSPAEADIQDRHLREDLTDGQSGAKPPWPQPLLLG